MSKHFGNFTTMTLVARRVRFAIYQQSCPVRMGVSIKLISHLHRFESLPFVMMFNQNAGDPGRLNRYHGCEARGI